MAPLLTNERESVRTGVPTAVLSVTVPGADTVVVPDPRMKPADQLAVPVMANVPAPAMVPPVIVNVPLWVAVAAAATSISPLVSRVAPPRVAPAPRIWRLLSNDRRP